MEFNTVLQRRYSCRAFAAQAVEQEKTARIIEAGRIAPTAVNKQPVHVWAVSDPDTLEAIRTRCGIPSTGEIGHAHDAHRLVFRR